MEEVFTTACPDAYYKIFTNQKDIGYKYRQLSPFEFKNTLTRLALKHWKGDETKMLDAGRGQPNFFSVVPRYAFALLTQIATELGVANEVGGEDHDDLGFMPSVKGITKRFHKILWRYRKTDEAKFLKVAIAKIKRITQENPDKLIHDIVLSCIGCYYPSPPRIQNFVEPVLTEFLDKVVFKPNKPFKNRVKLFPTEGATAAIIYVFDTLKYNGIVVPDDTIGILTPIFSPYLEIPALKNYNLKQICIQADGDENWEIPDSELQKIADPKVKAIFLVNPTNPTSMSLSAQTTRKIRSIVNKQNPNLVVITDNVYAPFVDEFNSLFDVLPYNTIAIYSLSKYFGVTGWRLGVVMMANNNVIDRRLLKDVSPDVHLRYSMIEIQPEKIPFIQRMLIDSRQVAEAHTAGLSTPQQTIMTLFAVHDLLDTKRVYNKKLKTLLRTRLNNLLGPLAYNVEQSPLNANYYVVLDLVKVVNNIFGGSDFGDYLQQHRDPLEFLLRLAKDYGTVLLVAVGFAGPFWGVRVSLANLPDGAYTNVGYAIRNLTEDYYREFQKWKEAEKKAAKKLELLKNKK